MSIPVKPSQEFGANSLDDLPDLPDLPSLNEVERAEMREWWRLVREVLKRNNEELQST